MFKGKKGFTLVELMIVIAILGVLASVAIPQYMNYVEASKIRAVKSNMNSAKNLIKAEFSKKNAGIASPTNQQIVDSLNDLDPVTTQFRNKNPYDSALQGFVLGAAAVPGDVGLTFSNEIAVMQAGVDQVVIDANWVEGGVQVNSGATPQGTNETVTITYQ